MIVQKKGLTLIEIILAMAILAILVVAFLPILGNSFVNIIEMGSRSKATAVAQTLIDQESYDDTSDAYNLIPYTDSSLMVSKPYVNGEDADGRYCITTNQISIPSLAGVLPAKSYNTVTVLIFYGRKNSSVVLTAMTKRSP